MLIEIVNWFGPSTPAVFKYVSFRAAMALISAFMISIVLGPWLIERLTRLKAGQQIRDDQGGGSISLKEMHRAKVGTPTAGGLLIALALVLPVAIFADPANGLVWILLTMTMGFATLGFIDDYLKITKKNSKGLAGKWKLVGQALLGCLLAAYLATDTDAVRYAITDDAGNTENILGSTFLAAPFFKNFYLNLGWFYLPWVMFMLMAWSNAVNLTDGLDGLAIGVSIIVAGAFAIVTYLISRADFAAYLYLPHVPKASEAIILLAAIIGGGMGFLWYNAHPAQVFMGDTGSLMLGGVFGSIAVVTKSEFLFVIIGGVFVWEALSVVLQVGSYRLTGKRIFRMAPIHHHFEKVGWAEPQIITRFYIIASLLALLGLSTLKMR